MNTPAFPTTEANGCNNGDPGITVRDYFAAKALPWFQENAINDPSNGRTWQQVAAVASYEMADAMMEARK